MRRRTPSPSPVAVVPSASQGPAASGSPVPGESTGTEPQPSGSTEPSASPSATPVPTPDTVPAPLTGMPVKPAIAGRRVMVVMVDDQFDARPQSGLSDADVVWQAPAEGGIPRYMAFFQTGDPPAVGPVRSSRLYFIAWASEWRSVYVHAGGSPQAKALLALVEGPRLLSSTTPTSSAGAAPLPVADPHAESAPAQRVHGRRSTCGGWRKRVGADPVAGQKPAWKFADPLPLEQRPVGGAARRPVPRQQDHLQVRPRDQHLPPLGHGREEADRRGHRRPGSRRPTWSSWRSASRRSTTAATRAASRPRSTGTGKAWISTNGKTIRGTWKKPRFRAKTRFFDRNGKQVTLTRGPDVRPGRAAEREGHGHARQGAARRRRRSARRAPGGPIGAVGRSSPESAALARRAAARRLEHRRRPRDLGPRPRASRARRPPTSARRRRRSRAAATSVAWRSSSDQAAPDRRREPRRVAGLHEDPGRPDDLGQGARSALATTGTPAAIASSAASPVASERTGWTRNRAPATSAARRSSGSRGA